MQSNLNKDFHLGLIFFQFSGRNKKPDGNRRFAKRLLQNPWKGHEWGSERLKEVFNWCSELGVRTITFYSLSLENMEKRPEQEIKYIYALMKRELDDVVNNKHNFVHKNKIRMIFFGTEPLN